MRRLLLALACLLILPTPALAQSDPCADVELAVGEAGVPYRGQCVAFTTDDAGVRTVIVRVTHDLVDGSSALCLVAIRTLDGWVAADQECYIDAGAEGLSVGDEGHVVFAGGK